MRRWSPVVLGAVVTLLVGLGATVASERTEAAPLPGLLTDASWRAAALDPAAAPDDEWLAAGSVPGQDGPWDEMVRSSLLDLRALTTAHGAVVAAPAHAWRYAWPRDSAFAAVAFSATGHREEALQVLRFLQDVQHEDGGFEARYLLDGSGTPDGRTRQSDGAGWALWALDEVVQDVRADEGPDAAREELRDLEPLLDAATAFVLDATGDGRELPAPSPDYWELRESHLTLGTAAPLLAGLRAGADLHVVLGERRTARDLRAAAASLASLVHGEFGAGGYQRYADAGHDRGGLDASVAFLLPPFQPGPVSPDVLAAFDGYQVDALRPAGGLAPGTGWRRDGVSWTPEVALVAYASAASGRTEQATAWLDWLNSHRTPWGALPEKVLPDGSPAGPAPLGWTAAEVVLAVDALDTPAG